MQRLIQLCIGSWSSGIGSSDVMRTLHTSTRPVSRQGTVVSDPRVPATPWVPLRCVQYYDAKIRLRSTKTRAELDQALHTLGGYVLLLMPIFDGSIIHCFVCSISLATFRLWIIYQMTTDSINFLFALCFVPDHIQLLFLGLSTCCKVFPNSSSTSK